MVRAHNEFYDIHVHAMNFSHPNLAALLQSAWNRKLETLYSQVSAIDYLAGTLARSGGENIYNLIAVMEHDPGSIFMLMEDDLRGVYAKQGDSAPLVAQKYLHSGNVAYERIVISPLIMDFSQHLGPSPDIYYNVLPVKSLDAQVVDVLSGIQQYRQKRPDGILEIHPFLGLDIGRFSLDTLAIFLDKNFSSYRTGRETGKAIFSRMSHYAAQAPMTDWSPFAGIKLYPPLGFDPWPDDAKAREKVEYLYTFCEKRKIPIITHCDDQGYRIIPLEESWQYTSPARYEPVLQRYPELKIDFAHFGRQYTAPALHRKSPVPWRDILLTLMTRYPNVYTDFSFNGVEESYYQQLTKLLQSLPDSVRDQVESRILFGSDFMINLTKIRSYADYYRIYEASALTPAQQHRFASENSRRFLFGD